MRMMKMAAIDHLHETCIYPSRKIRVLLNLCRNALQASSEGGEVTLTCRALDADTAALQVTDHGRGIEPQIVFLEATDEVLVRRYSETRHRHPLDNQNDGVQSAIARERAMLDEVREMAQTTIDTSGLAFKQLRERMQFEITRLAHELGITTVYVTHDQTEALTFADKVVVMYEGEVVQIGTPEELFDRPAHTFVGYFVGSPGMKKYNYNAYAKEPAFEYGGFKLFPVHGDYPVMTPTQVMTELFPPPVIMRPQDR